MQNLGVVQNIWSKGAFRMRHNVGKNGSSLCPHQWTMFFASELYMGVSVVCIR